MLALVELDRMDLETATLRPLNLTADEHAMLEVALRNPVLQHQPELRSLYCRFRPLSYLKNSTFRPSGICASSSLYRLT